MNNPFYQFRRFEYMLDNFSTLFINHHWLILFSIFFVAFLLNFLVFRSLNHVIFLGMSEDDREASKNIELNGKRQKRNIFSAIQYDKPYFSLLLIRQFGIFAKLIMLFLVAIFFTFFVISFLSALFDIDYVFQPYNVQYYLLTSNNYYGVSAIILAALFSYLSAALFYHKFIKSFFGDLDIEFNEDMIKKREKSSLRNDRLVDIRNYQFKKHEEYDPTLFFEDAEKRGALFLGIDENNQPIFFQKKNGMKLMFKSLVKWGVVKGYFLRLH